MSNFVYIATSLDGYISSPDNDLEWLDYVPAPEGDDLGFSEFISRVDAVVMGRHTFETVVGFNMGWVYPVPGIVLSSSITSVPKEFSSNVEITQGQPTEVIQFARDRGFQNLYIDGGITIRGFLREHLIDELIITQVPLLLGGGDRLFTELKEQMNFELVTSDVLLGQLVKNRYRKKRVEHN